MTALLNLETTVTGKLQQVNAADGFTYSVVLCPAADAYSFPPIVRIRSKRSLGRVGDEITDVPCRVVGWKRNFTYISKKTGLEERGVNVDMMLESVE